MDAASTSGTTAQPVSTTKRSSSEPAATSCISPADETDRSDRANAVDLAEPGAVLVGCDADPHAIGLTAARVVVVKALGNPSERVRLLPDPQPGNAQHAGERAPPHSARPSGSAPELPTPVHTAPVVICECDPPCPGAAMCSCGRMPAEWLLGVDRFGVIRHASRVRSWWLVGGTVGALGLLAGCTGPVDLTVVNLCSVDVTVRTYDGTLTSDGLWAPDADPVAEFVVPADGTVKQADALMFVTAPEEIRLVAPVEESYLVSIVDDLDDGAWTIPTSFCDRAES